MISIVRRLFNYFTQIAYGKCNLRNYSPRNPEKNMFSIFSIVHMGLRHTSMIFLLKSNKRKKH